MQRCPVSQRSRLIVAAIGVLAVSSCVPPPKRLVETYCRPWTQFFVAHSPGDDLALEDAIAAEIAARGLHVTSGPLAAMPAGTDILVIYELRWFQNILLRAEVLKIELRHVRTGATLAGASQRGFAVIGKRPQRLVADAVDAVFGAGSLDSSAGAE